MVEKNQKKNTISWYAKIIEIQISLSINKILLEHIALICYNCFCKELNTYKKECKGPQSLKHLLHRKSLPTSALK